MEEPAQLSHARQSANGADVDGLWPPYGVGELGSGQGGALFVYLQILKPWWRVIIITTAVLTLATLLFTLLAMPRWYQANAAIRAASQEPSSFQQLGINATGFNSLANSIGSVMGLTTNDTDSQEFLAIMTSFDFTTALLKARGLESHIRPTGLRKAIGWTVAALTSNKAQPINPDWGRYKLMKSRFRADYDHRTGNLNMTFLDENPEMSRAILGYYINDLRKKLRNRVIRYSQSAIAALNHEIESTDDPLLRTQLEGILAVDLQQEKTAEVQADFAFTVIEPPVLPNGIFSPHVMFDSLAVLLLTPLLLASVIIACQQIGHSYAQFQLQSAARSVDGQARNRQPFGDYPAPLELTQVVSSPSLKRD
jgi:hypothetical protein